MTEREYNRFKASEWRNANPERAREIRRQGYWRNRDAINERRRARYAEDAEYRERRLASIRKSRTNHPGGSGPAPNKAGPPFPNED